MTRSGRGKDRGRAKPGLGRGAEAPNAGDSVPGRHNDGTKGRSRNHRRKRIRDLVKDVERQVKREIAREYGGRMPIA